MKLYTYETGSKMQPAIVFLHGSPLSGRMWQPQWERLTDFHCLAPDLPEHGRSARIGPFAMDDAVRRLADLIRSAAPNGKAHVVGLSFGGVVAQALLSQMPEVVDRVILSGTAGRMNQALLALLKFQLVVNRPLLKRLAPDKVAALMCRQFGIPPQYIPTLGADIQRVPADAMLRFILASYADIQTPTQTQSPVLVVVGQKETPVAKVLARRLARAIPGAQGRSVPGLGHVWNLQAPELFAATVRAWVTDNPLPEKLAPL
ncbi:MAG TPA: alpha/beta hydrolase [Anaerolineae bacterium]|nr:alpha/beta hydrolase [Anaerolineae bacterium]